MPSSAPFPSVSASPPTDAFTRADQNPISGSGWGAADSWWPHQLLSNELYTDAAFRGSAYDSGAAIATVEAGIVTNNGISGDQWWIQLVDTNDATPDGYEFHVEPTLNEINRIDADVATYLNGTSGNQFSAGDRITCRVTSDGWVEMWRTRSGAHTLIVAVEDSNYTNFQHFILYCQSSGPTFDDFVWGEISAAQTSGWGIVVG